MSLPLVTIAIPFYNAEQYLRQALLSVVNQSYQNWELILVDDNSRDRSVDIAKEFSLRDERIRVICDGHNRGLATRLNETVNIAKGELYARMDADDIMDVDRIQTQVQYLAEYPDVDVVGSMAYIIDKDSNVISESNLVMENPKTVEDILNGGGFIHPSIMGKTSWFKQNPYDENLRRMQDLVLWLRSVEHSNFKILPSKLMFYRAVGIPTIKKDWQEFKCSNELYFTILYKEQGRKIRSVKMFLLSMFKLSVYMVFSIVGKTDYLVKRRYKPIDSRVREDALDRLHHAIRV